MRSLWQTTNLIMSLIRIHVHVVWSVKYRAALIDPAWRETLHPFIDGAIRARGHTPIETNTQEDHLHSVFRFSAREDIGDLLQHVKGESSRMINRELFRGDQRFRWQGGYGAFAVSYSALPTVIQYIRDQDEIHARRRLKFLSEYAAMVHRDNPIDEEPPHWFNPLI